MTTHPAIRRLTLVTDAWSPQVNGVVTTLSQLVKQLQNQGIEVDVIQPGDYPSIPLPTYKEIPWVWRAPDLAERLRQFEPEALHIATEGALGWKARKLAKRWGWPFTTAYHTQYPQYVRARAPIPESWTYALLRRFHRPATRTFVPTASMRETLSRAGFSHLTHMTRGVDNRYFHPHADRSPDYQKPPGLAETYYLYVGRVAPEKNLRAFLDLNLPGQKVVVGDGPERDALETDYPDALFTGAQSGANLAGLYAGARAFVFPSLTDTFGVVNIEAIACGTPVAAFPVTGPKDIITPDLNGVLSSDLYTAIIDAQSLKHPDLAKTIPEYTWRGASRQFLHNLAYIPQPMTQWMPQD
ncbi:glycosyltransferase family 4 protein [Hydrogenovibrio halophilus]|uniref:glycosyltransferase family 4 protein n=1 Tax=Hydrogenovibrio halophilus TaxID=373391 RepID=UPI00048DF670|nr:glycosyltransferase family 1 protein [Hydrogenovibrio halophilus]